MDDFLQDVARAFGPDERLRLSIVVSDIVVDGADESRCQDSTLFG